MFEIKKNKKKPVPFPKMKLFIAIFLNEIEYVKRNRHESKY